LRLNKIWAKKTLDTPGFEAFFAVTHQGPAQGGKAGGSKLPESNISKSRRN
jgi:hypothetical protein